MENKKNQEIDLGVVFAQTKNFFGSIIERFFKLIQYIINNILKIGIVLIFGLVIGYILDKKSVSYQQEIIVTPNSGSVDYLYKRVELLNSLIKEKDTNLLYKKGFKNIKKIGKIKIEPIVDIFKFVETNKDVNPNFDMIKLMAEDGDLSKIIKDEVTSKNYPYHLINLSTDFKIKDENLIAPIMKFLNENEYYLENLKQYKENTLYKLSQNDSIIKQIDQILLGFNSNSNKSSSLVYYNENTELNELIKTKNDLINEKGNLKIQLINLDKPIKEISYTTNIKDKTGINGKLLFLVPIIFVFLFFGLIQLKNTYFKYTSK